MAIFNSKLLVITRPGKSHHPEKMAPDLHISPASARSEWWLSAAGQRFTKRKCTERPCGNVCCMYAYTRYIKGDCKSNYFIMAKNHGYPVFVDHSHLLIVIDPYVHVKTVFAIYHPHI